MKKLRAIGVAFVVTVGPALVLFVSVMLGVPIVKASDDLFFPLSILGVLLNIPLGIVAVMAIYGGSFCVNIVYSNLRFFKVQDTIVEVDVNPSATSTAKFGFVLSLIMFFLMVPISLVLWLITSVFIVCDDKYADKVIGGGLKSSAKFLRLFLVCVLALGIACANFGLKSVQDAEYSIDGYTFEYVEFSHTGTERRSPVLTVENYDLKYKFRNNTKKECSLRGKIVIETRNLRVKYELKDKSLTVFENYYEQDFEDHLVYYHFFIDSGETEINNALRQDIEDIKIYLIVENANWGNGKTRDYDDGKIIVLKDFGT